jgi:methionine aminotransferase
MTPILQSKLPGVGTTIFTVMSALAERHGAINLSQGYPDFEPPAELLERVHFHLTHGRNQYPPMTGILPLREAIAAKTANLYGRDADPDKEVTVTSGATEALFCAIQAVVGRGDEVVLLDPAYDCYEPAVTLAGGKVLRVPLTFPDFAVDWQGLADALSKRTRLVVINSPHNPTGALLSTADLDRLAALLRATDILVLSDEVYEHIVFDGAQHNSVLAHPELAERSFAVFSFGKTYHATGWKVGYCVAPAALTREFRRVHQFNTFTTVTPMQWALADYLVSDPQHYQQLCGFYQTRRDHFLKHMAASRFSLRPSPGTYFQLADYSAISDQSDLEFASWLTAQVGVAAIPLSPFFGTPPSSRLVRFCFAKQRSTLSEACARLCRI